MLGSVRLRAAGRAAAGTHGVHQKVFCHACPVIDEGAGVEVADAWGNGRNAILAAGPAPATGGRLPGAARQGEGMP